MPVLTETNHVGEFIVSESNGSRSRSESAVTDSFVGVALLSGTVLEYVTPSDQYTTVVDAGTEDVAILYTELTATAPENAEIVVVARDAEVAAGRLTYPAGFTSIQIDAVNARLLAQGIKVV